MSSLREDKPTHLDEFTGMFQTHELFFPSPAKKIQNFNYTQIQGVRKIKLYYIIIFTEASLFLFLKSKPVVHRKTDVSVY